MATIPERVAERPSKAVPEFLKVLGIAKDRED